MTYKRERRRGFCGGEEWDVREADRKEGQKGQNGSWYIVWTRRGGRRGREGSGAFGPNVTLIAKVNYGPSRHHFAHRSHTHAHSPSLPQN